MSNLISSQHNNVATDFHCSSFCHLAYLSSFSLRQSPFNSAEDSVDDQLQGQKNLSGPVSSLLDVLLFLKYMTFRYRSSAVDHFSKKLFRIIVLVQKYYFMGLLFCFNPAKEMWTHDIVLQQAAKCLHTKSKIGSQFSLTHIHTHTHTLWTQWNKAIQHLGFITKQV